MNPRHACEGFHTQTPLDMEREEGSEISLPIMNSLEKKTGEGAGGSLEKKAIEAVEEEEPGRWATA